MKDYFVLPLLKEQRSQFLKASSDKYKGSIFRRQSKVDSAMTAVSAGPGKSASQIYFYDWSDNYRKVSLHIKVY